MYAETADQKKDFSCVKSGGSWGSSGSKLAAWLSTPCREYGE